MKGQQMINDLKTKYSRAPAVCERYGFSVPTLWRKSKEGTFPKPIKLSAGVTAWKNSQLDEWENDPLNYRDGA
jgi:predicted DNA-binding transcriptional regulator AlpA